MKFINNRNTRKRCEICSKLTIKTPRTMPLATTTTSTTTSLKVENYEILRI